MDDGECLIDRRRFSSTNFADTNEIHGSHQSQSRDRDQYFSYGSLNGVTEYSIHMIHAINLKNLFG